VVNACLELPSGHAGQDGLGHLEEAVRVELAGNGEPRPAYERLDAMRPLSGTGPETPRIADVLFRS